jgi:hypothetical protein
MTAHLTIDPSSRTEMVLWEASGASPDMAGRARFLAFLITPFIARYTRRPGGGPHA